MVGIQPSEASMLSKAVVEMTRALKIENNPTATIIVPSKSNDADDRTSEISTELGDALTLEIFDMDSVNFSIESLLNIVIIRRLEQFEPIPGFYDRKFLNFRGFLIVGFDNDSMSRDNDVQTMLDHLWLMNITKANILVRGTNEHEINVLTGFPFQSENCGGGVEVRNINIFKGHNFTSDELFVDKFANLNGCTLNFTAFVGKPTNSFYNEDGKTGSVYGIDVSLFEGKI